jgi:maltooligosyltrehalose trehalohydrolase
MLGATCKDGATRFRVWAPKMRALSVHLLDEGVYVPLVKDAEGYFTGVAERAVRDYLYSLDGRAERPDPASRHQPHGVHGPSRVVGDEHRWRDEAWHGRALDEYVIYELHVGAFTAAGTLDAAAAELDRLATLGITAVQLMPLAECPGSRNWGYDGVFPFSVGERYGGPSALRRFVDACHARGLCVVLDVVYNHLGPDGNHLGEYGPYFSERRRTPWGAALSFDGEESDHVRAYFLENARMWIEDYHVDALRLDAVQTMEDGTAEPFLLDLAEHVRAAGERQERLVHTIAESDQNDPRLLAPREHCGLSLDAQSSDDFHHALHALLTGERHGYYADFGSTDALAAAHRDAFFLAGRRSLFRKRKHGRAPRGETSERFVVCAQNHDVIGNRRLGERLITLGGVQAQELAAVSVLLSPFTPLLFMGEEYGERAPFRYFVHHGDPAVVEAVRRGRDADLAATGAGPLPDPQAEATFQESKLTRIVDERIAALYAVLIALRKQHVRPHRVGVGDILAYSEGAVLVVGHGALRYLLNFGAASVMAPVLRWGEGVYKLILTTNDATRTVHLRSGDQRVRMGGQSAAVYLREGS